jgi:hypothetical protein
LKDFVRLDWPEPRKQGGRLEGEVIYIDRFGNAITNLEVSRVRGQKRILCEVHARRRLVCPLKTFYQDVARGEAVALTGSSGLVEIAVNGSSAEKVLGLRIGARVVLRPG